MDTVLTQQQGYAFLGGFFLLAWLAIRSSFRQRLTSLAFLVSNRTVGPILGAITVTVSWVWAPSLFVSSQTAYETGIPALAWFILPNAGALVLFAFLSTRMREVFPQGFTLPEFVEQRLESRRIKTLYMIGIFVVQCFAVIVNLTGALLIINLVTGIPKETLIILLAGMMIVLSLMKGIRSSLVGDVIKAVMIALVVFVIVPMSITASGGFSSITTGAASKNTNLFDPMVAWTYGIPITVSLFAAVVIDQQQWQRAFSMRFTAIRSSYLIGALLFIVPPLVLGWLGFIAADSALNVPVTQPQLAGFATVLHFLPTAAVLAFTLMLLAALIATGGAALSAIASIGAVDFYRSVHPRASDAALVTASRASMVVLILVGVGVALIPNVSILYLQLGVGAFRAALLVPTILCLFKSRLSEPHVFWSILLGMIVGLPLFWYGSVIKNPTISTLGSLLPIVITLIAWYLGRAHAKVYNFALLAQKGGTHP